MNTKLTGRPLDIALTIVAREYKGFGSSHELSNGVVEWN